MERRGGVSHVAVAYKDISRALWSNQCGFGFNDKSWSLNCDGNSYSSRIGVYLDHSAGVLSFYSVSDTMTLLHRVQTTFTQPLYSRVYVIFEFSYLKQT